MNIWLLIGVILGTGFYMGIGLLQFFNEVQTDGIGRAFGWGGTPFSIIVFRAIFWPLLMVLGAFIDLYCYIHEKEGKK